MQSDTPGPHILRLDPKGRDVLQQGLFDEALSERDLLAVNHRDTLYIREITQVVDGETGIHMMQKAWPKKS